MNKLILSIVLIASVAITSCQKDAIFPGESAGYKGVANEASTEPGIIIVQNSNYKRTETEALQRTSANDGYSDGTIEYTEDGKVTSVISFGGVINKATQTTDAGKKDITLKNPSKGDGYVKVIVEPLVKSIDCKEIVAGTIEFQKDGKWVATIDFGDGTCDDLATKITSKGTTVFSIKDAWSK